MNRAGHTATTVAIRPKTGVETPFLSARGKHVEYLSDVTEALGRCCVEKVLHDCLHGFGRPTTHLPQVFTNKKILLLLIFLLLFYAIWQQYLTLIKDQQRKVVFVT